MPGSFQACFSTHPNSAGRLLRNPSAEIGPPESKRKVHSDYDHEQSQDRIPLSPDSLEL